MSEDDSFILSDHEPVVKKPKKAPTPKKSSKKTVEEIYQKKTQLEHILLRPDSYIGSTEQIIQPMWVWDKLNQKIVSRNIAFVPGLFKIFDEILVNAADNKIRDSSMDTLKVSIDKENNLISVYNNGKGIPIEMHAKEHVYVPELIFGHLLTSSNYDDDEKKVTGGRNGYGAKLANIFSLEFTVETADGSSGQKFKQTYKNNMSEKSKPVITSYSREDFTRITFKPDLARFKMTHIDDGLESLLMKRVYDLAGSVKDIKVFLNEERIKIKGFKQYIDLYLSSDPANRPPIVHEVLNDRWEVCASISDGQFQQVSFVNSICTYKGGTHVNYISDQIVDHLMELIGKKNKAAPVKPFQVRNHLWIFINCLIENPSFDSQTKENMTLKVSSFGSKASFSDDFFKKFAKSGIVDQVLNWAKNKQDQLLKKTDGHKKSRVSGISKLDDANNAGTKNASKCTLILTEGDSAKALAVSGLAVVGRDNYGVFPLRGKLLNVREASHKQIMENQEINYIKQILGLQHGKQYSSTDSLRYGHLMIMTDQDHDGSHIKGLLINFIDHFWPSLLQVPGFLLEFITPIVKVTKGKQEVSFFTIPEYENWKAAHDDGKGWIIKYYKGLGTSTSADAKKYFSNMTLHMKQFSKVNPEDRNEIDLAFSKKRADNRKEWLKNYVPGTFIDHKQSSISVTDFINKELILFSVADNQRSIPSIVDGFKPGHRKIMFSCFKRKLKGEIKVAQLAGYVSEHSAYHHGEQSLCSTIVGLAQNYVGSNNVNLLEPIGQFGTRLQGGKDAASPRYIFTSLSPFARLLFNIDDDKILKYLNDDGQSIEPEWYVPILPLVLVNGTEGIGTGWSTSIPNFNPADIVQNLYRLMDGQEQYKMKPWYRGFGGTIEESGINKYKVTGVFNVVDDCVLEVTELPVGTWTQSYKEFLETLLQGTEENPQFIKDFREYHTDTTVKFAITMTPQKMKEAENEGIEKKFKLSSSLSLGNIVCFDPHHKIKKYDSPEQILEDFYDLRLEFYHKRKAYLTDALTKEWNKLDNKVKFILEIIEGTLKIQNRKRDDVIKDLKSKGYQPFGKESEVQEETADTDFEAGGNYDYLLSMPLWSLTRERVESLKRDRDEKEAELEKLLALSSKDLWKIDLEAFMTEWNKISAPVSSSEPKRVISAKRKVDTQEIVVEDSVPAVKKAKKQLKIKDSDDESLKKSSSTESIASQPKITDFLLEPKKVVQQTSISDMKPWSKFLFKDEKKATGSKDDLLAKVDKIFDTSPVKVTKKAAAPRKVKAASKDDDFISSNSDDEPIIKKTKSKPLVPKKKTVIESDEDDLPVTFLTKKKQEKTKESAKPALSNKIAKAKKPVSDDESESYGESDVSLSPVEERKPSVRSTKNTKKIVISDDETASEYSE